MVFMLKIHIGQIKYDENGQGIEVQTFNRRKPSKSWSNNWFPFK